MAFKKGLVQSDEQQSILNAVYRGEITTSEADQLSMELGYGPLASRPAMAGYRLHHKPTWNIVMSIAWILWRDYEAVTHFYDPYRRCCFYWWRRQQELPPPPAPGARRAVGGIKPKVQLRRLEPATFVDLTAVSYEKAVAGGVDNRICEDHREAKDLLWNSLIMGEITAWGIDHQKTPVEIDPHHWGNLTLVQTSSSDLVPSSCAVAVPSYRHVQLRRQDVERVWKASSIPANVKVPVAREPSGRSPAFREIERAISHLWPAGDVPYGVTVRNNAIVEFLKAQGRVNALSDKTLERFFKIYREEK